MSGIDDPLEAVKQQNRQNAAGPLSVLIDVLGPLHPYLGVVAVFKQFSSQAETNARVQDLFGALEWYVLRHESKLEELQLERQLETPAAKEAVIAAVTETILSPDIEKIKRFGAILGYNFMGRSGKAQWERASAYIRDLAQLGDEDIRVLQILHDLQKQMFIGRDEKPDQLQFPRVMERALINAERDGISREDVYARCARLNGFGLCLQMERPRGTVGVDYVYRLTRLGKKLMDILQGGRP